MMKMKKKKIKMTKLEIDFQSKVDEKRKNIIKQQEDYRRIAT